MLRQHQRHVSPGSTRACALQHHGHCPTPTRGKLDNTQSEKCIHNRFPIPTRVTCVKIANLRNKGLWTLGHTRHYHYVYLGIVRMSQPLIISVPTLSSPTSSSLSASNPSSSTSNGMKMATCQPKLHQVMLLLDQCRAAFDLLRLNLQEC